MVRTASLLALLVLFALGGVGAEARTGAVLAVEAPIEIVVSAEEIPCEPEVPADRVGSAVETRTDGTVRTPARSRTAPATPPPER